MRIVRAWANPSADTFDCPPIGEMVRRYLASSRESIDPFARNKRWATHTNDLDPDTAAEHHMDAEDFCRELDARGVQADLGIFDPPYSPRQISEVYRGIGLAVGMEETQNARLYARVRRALGRLIEVGGVVLSFGWNSHGMSNAGGREWSIEEILLVCHGGAHNDTICMAERRLSRQTELFDINDLRSAEVANLEGEGGVQNALSL